MSTTYPATKQTFSDPAGTNNLDSPDHAVLHTNKNDTIEAIEDTLGTTLGTNLAKDFAAGQFPARVTSTGTFAQNLGGGTVTSSIINNMQGTLGFFNKGTLGSVASVGGTFQNALLGTNQITGGTVNNSVVGTPEITGGTSTAMKVVGTDILSNAGLFGTTGIKTAESVTIGSFTNTAFGNGTNLGSFNFTPQVDVKCLIQTHVMWDQTGAAGVAGSAALQINGTTFGTSSGGGGYIYREFDAGNSANTNSSFYVTPTLPANTAATVIVPHSVASGTLRIFRYFTMVLPFPAT